MDFIPIFEFIAGIAFAGFGFFFLIGTTLGELHGMLTFDNVFAGYMWSMVTFLPAGILFSEAVDGIRKSMKREE